MNIPKTVLSPHAQRSPTRQKNWRLIHKYDPVTNTITLHESARIRTKTMTSVGGTKNEYNKSFRFTHRGGPQSPEARTGVMNPISALSAIASNAIVDGLVKHMQSAMQRMALLPQSKRQLRKARES